MISMLKEKGAKTWDDVDSLEIGKADYKSLPTIPCYYFSEQYVT